MRSLAVLNAALLAVLKLAVLGLAVPSLTVPSLAQTARFADPVALDIVVPRNLNGLPCAVCAADLDGDGDRDLLLGRTKLLRFTNDGTDAEPRFGAAETVTTVAGDIKITPG